MEHWGEVTVALRDALMRKRPIDSVEWSTAPDRSRAVAERVANIGYFGLFLPAGLMRSGTPTERRDLETLYRNLNRHSWTGFDIIVPSASSFLREHRVVEDQKAAFEQDREHLIGQLGIDLPKVDSVVLLDAGGDVGVVELPDTTSGLDDGLRSVARAMASGTTAAQAAAIASSCQGRSRKWGKSQWSGAVDAWAESMAEADEWQRSVEAGADNDDRVRIAMRRAEEHKALEAARSRNRVSASVSSIMFLCSVVKVHPESGDGELASRRGTFVEVESAHQMDDIDFEIQLPDWYATAWSGEGWPPKDSAYEDVARALDNQSRTT